MKIASVTEDGITISNHFGRAPYYRVLIIHEDRVVEAEMRTKPYHGQSEGHTHTKHQSLHEDMFAPIVDCEILLCGGMGEPAYQNAIAAGLDVVLTGGDIDAAVLAYLSGHLTSDLRRIHHH